MKRRVNDVIDSISNYLAYRKGLLPMLGILLILMNWLIQFIPGLDWLAQSNTFLHLGIILAFIGFMVAWAL